MHSKFFLALVSIVCVMGAMAPSVASAVEDDMDIETFDYDPIEPVNRAIYDFNYTVDGFILKPVAQAYRYTVPQQGRTAISNVITNSKLPVVFLNSVLQLDAENASNSFGRFLVNTMYGFGGIFDVASEAGVGAARPEDFGQTLGYWGVSAGPYLVLPILGPSNLRDTFGLAVDIASTPYIWFTDPETETVIAIVMMVDAREQLLETMDGIYNSSIDSYATIRTYYQQRRSAMVANYSRISTPRVSY